MSTDFSVVPEQKPPSSGRRWTVIILVTAGVLILCTLVCCGGMIIGGPQIGVWSAATMCNIQYPDLGQAKCQAWGEDMFTNHFQEFSECNQAAQEGGTANPTKLFQCMEDKGLGPRSK